MEPATIRVLLADDHAIVRSGLRLLIDSQPDMEVVAEAEDGPEAVEKAREQPPDVAVLDISMPGGSGLDAIAQIRSSCPGTRVLVLSMHDDEAYLRSALEAGAAGYVVKRADESELLSAIRQVHQGRSYINVSLTGHGLESMFEDGARSAPQQPGEPSLSERERDVLLLVSQGFTNVEIAKRLAVSVRTVSSCRSRISEKLGLRSRAEFVRYALDLGLLGSDQA